MCLQWLGAKLNNCPRVKYFLCRRKYKEKDDESESSCGLVHVQIAYKPKYPKIGREEETGLGKEVKRNSEPCRNKDCVESSGCYYGKCGHAHISSLLTFLFSYDGEVPNERDDEHMSLTFIVKAWGKNKKTFLVKYEAK